MNLTGGRIKGNIRTTLELRTPYVGSPGTDGVDRTPAGSRDAADGLTSSRGVSGLVYGWGKTNNMFR